MLLCVVCCLVFVVCCLINVVCLFVFVVFCSSYVVYCVLFVVIGRWLSFIGCLSLVVRGWWVVVGGVVGCWLLRSVCW